MSSQWNHRPIPILTAGSDGAFRIMDEVEYMTLQDGNEVRRLGQRSTRMEQRRVAEELLRILGLIGQDLPFIRENLGNEVGVTMLAHVYRQLQDSIGPAIVQLRENVHPSQGLPAMYQGIDENDWSSPDPEVDLDEGLEDQITAAILGRSSAGDQNQEARLRYLAALEQLQSLMMEAGYASGDVKPPRWVGRQWNSIVETHQALYPFRNETEVDLAMQPITRLSEELQSLPSYQDLSPRSAVRSEATAAPMMSPPSYRESPSPSLLPPIDVARLFE